MTTTVLDPSTTDSGPRLGRSISLEHAAQILGVSRRTIYNRIRDGRLQTIRTLGGSQRILLDETLKYLSQSQSQSCPPLQASSAQDSHAE